MAGKSKKGKALVRNASDPQQVKNAGRDEKELRRRERNDIEFLLSSPQGRRFLWKLLSECGIYELSYVTDSDMTAFNEGRRCVGNNILADILDVDPDGFTTLIKENREVEDLDEEEPEKADDDGEKD